MSEQNHSPSDFERMSLDQIIEVVTADLESSTGHYVQFGLPSQQSSSHNWGDYNPDRLQRYSSRATTHPNTSNIQAVNPMPISVDMHPKSPTYDAPIADPIYFPTQTVNHLAINENDDLVGMIDVGGGNYINVIYGNASQFLTEQCQLNSLNSDSNQSIIDQEYGLFGNQQVSISSSISARTFNSKHFIDNLVGNWVPNQSGTYSPFGGSSNVTPVPQSTPGVVDLDRIPRAIPDPHKKKMRMVAEVKPMRPSYSDVLTKSLPISSPQTVSPITSKQEGSAKKTISKKNKTKPAILKRQNSSGSDDHNSPKFEASKRMLKKNKSNLPRRWVSLDNLGVPTESELNLFGRPDNFEKKRFLKSLKKGEKNETLNNSKIQNGDTKQMASAQKRPIQINNNLNIMSSCSQTASTDKIEKNQQANIKIFKEDKKVAKEKGSKRYQAEKAQQIRKSQRSRKRENKESALKDLYRNSIKYVIRWSKIALKIFYWLLHLICDIVNMSANLIIQLGKCGWYYTILYMKYSRIYLATSFSKIRFFNAFGKQMDSWLGSSKFAFWHRLKTKSGGKEETPTPCIHGGLEANIALPSTGEEAMKRLLACKGKDPYSILGVTPTCSDDDIKKYYKRQAFLVHPDKNSQPGAEEAFKILVHAFDLIGEPELRQAFDQTRQVEVAWGELSDLLSQLHRKMEQAANTIRCTNCGLRHKRVPTHRPCYAARFCTQCKIRHGAKEGDIWAESRVMGFLWHYYACMEGAIYDVTDWAACQAGNLKHLRANTHSVQYRIVLGQRPPTQSPTGSKSRQQMDPNTSEADFEDFINNLYNHSKPGSASSSEQNRGDKRKRRAKRKK